MYYPRLAIYCICLSSICSVLYGQNTINDPHDPENVERFANSFFNAYMDSLNIPGAVFVLVNDEGLIFSKGYGYSNIETKTKVNPDNTLFRVGSISKLITATAIMQLYEQGSIELDKDVNIYTKDFDVDAGFRTPISIGQLLTHTGGFVDSFIGLSVKSKDDLQNLNNFLASTMPVRVYTPGKIISYCNHCYGLLGLVIEDVSGMNYLEYIEKNIFSPLEMNHSSFTLSDPQSPNLAKSYYVNSNKAYTYDYIQIPSAASLITTAHDMADFMIAHLRNGAFKGNQILSGKTIQKMQSRQFSHHPELPGWCYGFSEIYQNNQRGIGHSAWWQGFGSLLFLLPKEKIGFFVTYNRANNLFQTYLFNSFMNHYYPVKKDKLQIRNTAAETDHYDNLTGFYRYVRYDRKMKFVGSWKFGSEIKISEDNKGNLLVDSMIYQQIEPLLFKGRNATKISFGIGDDGNSTHLFLGNEAFERIRWYESNFFHFKIWQLCLIFSLVAISIWPAYILINRFGGKNNASDKWLVFAKPAKILGIAISLLNLIFIYSIHYLLGKIDTFDYAFGYPKILGSSLFIPKLNSILFIGLLILLVPVWKGDKWSLVERLFYTLVVFINIFFISSLIYWDIL